jgi:hypothetical protein
MCKSHYVLYYFMVFCGNIILFSYKSNVITMSVYSLSVISVNSYTVSNHCEIIDKIIIENVV